MSLRHRAAPISWTTRMLLAASVAALAAALLASAAVASSGSASPGSSLGATGTAGQPIPVFAYYYMWYNPSSWNRAKMDYSALGRYSSSDVKVMRQQVDLAKQAGISGFLVSWKDTAVLDARLAALVRVCAAAHFKLGIVFEGLDFQRNPIPMSEVRSSFSYFTDRYANSPVFSVSGKPIVVWAGTWDYTSTQMASITSVYRPRLTILASEKQVASYVAVAPLFDGNAYYWSSVDPLSTPRYQSKLDAFSAAVHSHGGLWIAPAAPGFNATLLGGTRIVPRRGGQTLRLEMGAALASSPDAIGLISWNEFSENSAVEPSQMYGSSTLKTLAAIQHAHPGAIPNFDSSGPVGSSAGAGPFAILGAIGVVFVASAVVVARRGGRRRDVRSAPGSPSTIGQASRRSR
jgi:Glycosyl hydrolase family 99